MAFSSLLRRLAGLALPIAVLPACSADRYVPSVAVGSPSSPDRQLVGRVNGKGDELLGRVGEVSSYSPPPKQNLGSQGLDYLNTPNLAGTGPAVTAEAAQPADEGLPPIDGGYENQGMVSASALPPIDGGYDEPVGGDIQPQFVETGDGVNIDAGLGIAPAYPPQGQSQAQAQSQILQPPVTQDGISLAEGVTSQPVVDGIGFDDPVTLEPNSYMTPDTETVTGTAPTKK